MATLRLPLNPCGGGPYNYDKPMTRIMFLFVKSVYDYRLFNYQTDTTNDWSRSLTKTKSWLLPGFLYVPPLNVRSEK